MYRRRDDDSDALLALIANRRPDGILDDGTATAMHASGAGTRMVAYRHPNDPKKIIIAGCAVEYYNGAPMEGGRMEMCVPLFASTMTRAEFVRKYRKR